MGANKNFTNRIYHYIYFSFILNHMFSIDVRRFEQEDVANAERGRGWTGFWSLQIRTSR